MQFVQRKRTRTMSSRYHHRLLRIPTGSDTPSNQPRPSTGTRTLQRLSVPSVLMMQHHPDSIPKEPAPYDEEVASLGDGERSLITCRNSETSCFTTGVKDGTALGHGCEGDFDAEFDEPEEETGPEKAAINAGEYPSYATTSVSLSKHIPLALSSSLSEPARSPRRPQRSSKIGRGFRQEKKLVRFADVDIGSPFGGGSARVDTSKGD